jgi:UDP-GlcNAc3NAcA epimerase
LIKILTVVGARPQFVKAAALSTAINRDYLGRIQETIVHTGQHFDKNMSEVFFEQLGIPQPARVLKTQNGSHGVATGGMLADLDSVILGSSPDVVLVYGDTNSTLAAALSAAKLNIPIAHVEAGMRSWNRRMPEEINRVVTDHLSAINFASSEVAMENLSGEGLEKTSQLVGDIMYDAVLMFEAAEINSGALRAECKFDFEAEDFILATIHRQENTDDPKRLSGIIEGLNALAESHVIVLPMHPRLKSSLQDLGLDKKINENIRVISPASYLEMLKLVKNCRVVVTDSGGLQKEAFFLRVPCVTLRGETEWTETVDLGWNTLCEPQKSAIVDVVNRKIGSIGLEGSPYGFGDTSSRILNLLLMNFSK